eukprot:6887110-Prorocentrum_lima.AAC.1
MPMRTSLSVGPCSRRCGSPRPAPATHASHHVRYGVCPAASCAYFSATVTTGGLGRGRIGAASPPS